jgi:hypothetical protein
MGRELSVTQILANLEKQLSFHREQEALHREKEAFHRDQRAHHAAEFERLSQQFEAFKTAVDTVEPAIRVAEAVTAAPPPPPPPPDDRDLGRKPKPSQAVDRVLRSWPDGEPFGASAVTAAVNRRFAGKVPPVDVRTISSFLRRRRENGLLEEVREGLPFHEALYRKVAGAWG